MTGLPARRSGFGTQQGWFSLLPYPHVSDKLSYT